MQKEMSSKGRRVAVLSEPGKARTAAGGARALSGRSRTALMRHQHRLSTQATQVRRAERVLTGTLAACDRLTQKEMIATFLETVQELSASLQRVETFLASRIGGLAPQPPAASAGELGAKER